MDRLEAFDQRLFLRGLALTSAGLIVPKAVISVPKPAALPAEFGRVRYYVIDGEGGSHSGYADLLLGQCLDLSALTLEISRSVVPLRAAPPRYLRLSGNSPGDCDTVWS